MIFLGPDSSRSMGSQSSCSSGKCAPRGLFRERPWSVTRWFPHSTVQRGLIAQLSSEGGKDAPWLVKNCLLVAFFQVYASGTITLQIWKGFRLRWRQAV